MNKEKEMKKDYDELRKLKDHVTLALKEAPPGSLRISKHGKYAQYFHLGVDGSGKTNGKYLKKDDMALAAALAQKAYDAAMLVEIKRQLKILDKCPGFADFSSLGNVFGNMSEERRAMVNPYILPDDEFARIWMNKPYERLIFGPGTPEIWTESGIRVRSKSEKMIADKLTYGKVPFRCEVPLNIPGFGIVYPDFQIMKMSIRRVIYLEHFGMMDDPEYSCKAIRKIEALTLGGYIPGEDVFFTFESREQPLNMKVFNIMSEHSFR